MFLKKHKGDKFNNFLEEINALSKEGIFFTDTHAHIHFDSHFDDVDSLLVQARENGVNRVVTVGIDYEDSVKALALAKQYDNVFATVGVHPHDAKNFSINTISNFESMLTDKKVIAVGEIGLDYYRNHSPKDIQKEVFLTFLNMAISNNKPVVLHNRDASTDCISVMDTVDFKLDNPGIVHCFNGDREILKWALDKGFMISYAGPVTYSKADGLRDTVRYVPLDRLLIETDCPYLTPSPYRGRTNEPGYVAFTAYAISRIKEISVLQLAEQLERNFDDLFGVS